MTDWLVVVVQGAEEVGAGEMFCVTDGNVESDEDGFVPPLSVGVAGSVGHEPRQPNDEGTRVGDSGKVTAVAPVACSNACPAAVSCPDGSTRLYSVCPVTTY